jgi:hypothetical protein
MVNETTSCVRVRVRVRVCVCMHMFIHICVSYYIKSNLRLWFDLPNNKKTQHYRAAATYVIGLMLWQYINL